MTQISWLQDNVLDVHVLIFRYSRYISVFHIIRVHV